MAYTRKLYANFLTNEYLLGSTIYTFNDAVQQITAATTTDTSIGWPGGVPVQNANGLLWEWSGMGGSSAPQLTLLFSAVIKNLLTLGNGFTAVISYIPIVNQGTNLSIGVPFTLWIANGVAQTTTQEIRVNFDKFAPISTDINIFNPGFVAATLNDLPSSSAVAQSAFSYIPNDGIYMSTNGGVVASGNFVGNPVTDLFGGVGLGGHGYAIDFINTPGQNYTQMLAIYEAIPAINLPTLSALGYIPPPIFPPPAPPVTPSSVLAAIGQIPGVPLKYNNGLWR